MFNHGYSIFTLLRRILVIVLLAGLVAPATVQAANADPGKLIDFSLQDQFGDLHTQEDAVGRVVMLIGSDGDGSEFNDLWGSAIAQAMSDQPGFATLVQLPYADLRAVPFFAKGIARGMMPESPAEWVLMDWKGSIAKHYQFQPGATNILLFSPDGTLQQHVWGQVPDAATLESVISELRAALEQASPSSQ